MSDPVIKSHVPLRPSSPRSEASKLSSEAASASPNDTKESTLIAEEPDVASNVIPLHPIKSEAGTPEQKPSNKNERTATVKERLYEQVNNRVRELIPGTLELCRLLFQVKEEELFRYAKPAYESFQKWAAAEHPLAKSSFHQYLNSGRVCKLLDGSTSVDRPQNQAQLRPLLGIDDPKQVVAVWSKAQELAKIEPSGGNHVTENTVAKAKRMVLGIKRPSVPNAPRQRLETELAAVWKVWAADEKGQFIQVLWNQSRDYFSRLVADDFPCESDYYWFKDRLEDPKAESKRSATSDPGSISTVNPKTKPPETADKPAAVAASLKISKTREARQKADDSKRNTVHDHLSKVRDELRSIATDWQQPGLASGRESQEAREAAVIILRSAIERMEAIINSFGVAGDSNVDGSKSIGQIRFSTRIISRGPRVRRVWQAARITDQIADLIRNSAPETATELKAILAELRRIGASNNRVLRISRKPVYLRVTEDAAAQVR